MHIQPGSGCGRIDKEDLICSTHLGQVKSTRTSKIVVSVKDLLLLGERAKDMGRSPVFFLSFLGKRNVRYVLIPLTEWIEVGR